MFCLLIFRSFCPDGAGVPTTCTAGINLCKNIPKIALFLKWCRECAKIHFLVHGLFDVDSGNYCPIGSVAVIQCPTGTWGSTTGLTNATCSGQCTAGMGFFLYSFCGTSNVTFL